MRPGPALLLPLVLAACRQECPRDFDCDGAVDEADCAPEDPAIHPGIDEICDDLDGGVPVDNDCDGRANEADPDCSGAGDDDTGDDDTGDDDTGDDDTGDDDAGDDDSSGPCGDVAEGEVDADGDGFEAGADCDCDDGDASVHPGAPEALDTVDQACDGALDVLDPGDALALSGGVFFGTQSWALFGAELSLGDLDGDDNPELCVRSGASGEAYVYWDLWALLPSAGGAFRDIDAASRIEGLRGNGSIDCTRDLDGAAGNELVVTSWGEDGGEVLVYTAADLGNLPAGPDDASARWPETQDDTTWGLCLGIGDLVGPWQDESQEILIGGMGDGDDASYVLLGWQDGALVSRGTTTSPGYGGAGGVRCWVVGDLGPVEDELDEIVLDGGTRTRLLDSNVPLGGPALHEWTSIQASAVTSIELTGDFRPDLVFADAWMDASAAGDRPESGVVAVYPGGLSSLQWFGAEGDGVVDPDIGWAIAGATPYEHFGAALCGWGDLHGDGAADFAVGSGGDAGQGVDEALAAFRGDQLADLAVDGRVPPSAAAVRVSGAAGTGLGDPGRCDLRWPSPSDTPAWLFVRQPTASVGGQDAAGQIAWWPNHAFE